MWGDDLQELLGLWDGGPIVAEGPIYRGPDDHWIYDLPPLALYELPPPVRNVSAAADPAPLLVRINKPTWFRSAEGATMDDDLYGDPLTRLALGQAGTVEKGGPYYGYDGPVPVFNLSEAAQATQRLFPGWTLPKIGLPALGFPNTPKATQQQAAPGAALTTYLIYGALALAVVLLVRR